MPTLKKEQEQAIFHDDGNILVSASAGSGKTFVMIERLIRLVSQGKASVKEILAVTFTEKAAGEMKEKLKVALTKKISESGDKRLIKELAEVSTADISTMHAFCGRLIRLYFFACGIAPDFKIIDKDQAYALKNECVNRAFRELYEQGEEWFSRLVLRHSQYRSDANLKKFVIKMSERGLVNADGDIYLKQAQKIYTTEYFNKLLDEYKNSVNIQLDEMLEVLNYALPRFEEQGKANAVEFFTDLRQDIQTLRSSNDIYGAKQFENYKKDLPRKDMNFKGELKDIYEQAKDVRERFKSVVKKLCVGLTDRASDTASLLSEREHVLDLFKVVNKFESIYEQAKKEDNSLDFADLEHCALQVLADEQIRAEVKNKYKYIFVDEYQDTNGVQEAIISALEKDNVFMVGDAKQSIYGFRGCRPEIFIEKLNSMSKNGQKTVLLNHNFRSCDSVIELVNKVFSYSMTQKFFGLSYKDTSCLQAGGLYDKENCGRVQLHLLQTKKSPSKPLEKPRIYDVLEEVNKPQGKNTSPSTTLIASIINDELKKDFYDIKVKEVRPVNFGDIAVLTRQRDNAYVKDIVNGLIGYGIPVVSVVKENVCDYPEIRQFISILKLIDCFNQDIPLASALKSPLGNFTDEQLAQIVLADGEQKAGENFYNSFMRYLQTQSAPLQKRLKEFYDYFTLLRTLSDFVGAHGVLKRMIQDKNIEQCLLAEQFGEQKIKRLRRFISASVVDGKTLSVKEFLDRIERFPEAFGISDGAEENAVKVMTIHASKGLEFPVVIVCGLEKHSNSSDESEEIMFEQDLGFAVKRYDDGARTTGETPMRNIFRQRLSENRLKEELRVFYVALTRAEYSLHLTFSGAGDSRKKVFNGANRFLDYLPSDIELTEHTPEEFALMNKALESKKVVIGQADEEIARQMQQDFSYKYPFEADTLLPLKNSVTKATHQLTEDTPPVHVLFDDDAPDVEKGNVAHKIMEHFDFNSSLDLKAQVEGLILNGVVTRAQVDSVNLNRLERATSSPAFALLKGRTLYREKDFIVSVNASMAFDTDSAEQVLLQGVVDLLAVGENDAVIIDYKYSSLEIQSLKNRYAKQLDLYAYALEKATKIKTAQKILVNLFTGESIAFD